MTTANAPVVEERVEIGELRDAARGDDGAGRERQREALRRLEVRPRAHAVAADVGVEHGAPRPRARPRQSHVDGVGRCLRSSPRRRPCPRARRRRRRSAGASARRLATMRDLDGRRAEHDVVRRRASNSALAVVDACARRRPPRPRGASLDDLADDGAVVGARLAACRTRASRSTTWTTRARRLPATRRARSPRARCCRPWRSRASPCARRTA